MREPIPRLSRMREERGQVIVFVVLAFVILIGMIGITIDIGYAYKTQRDLQSAADAAALAGAQELPDATAATTMATQYGASSTGGNKITKVPVTESITTSCVTSIPGCNPVNTVAVNETADVPTFFAKVFGLSSFKVHVKATACSPCGSKPVDVMLVLDRTGSMCQDSLGRADPACTDLNNARAGIKSFLSNFDPKIAWVGLAVLPPATTVSNRCAAPATGNYNSLTAAYTIVPMSNDYKNADGSWNNSSNFLTTLACVQGAGSTSYSNAIEAAQAELEKDGRPKVPDVIVFMSDGAANIGPSYYASNSPYRTQPCHQGVTSSGLAKAKGTTVYSIGYAVDDDTGGCVNSVPNPDVPESPAITIRQALSGIASDPSNYFEKPGPGQLTGIYNAIAQDIAHGASSLIG
jgi:Flp pilus assembly protein TadG